MIGCVSIALSSVKFAIISKCWTWHFQTQRYRKSQHSTTAQILAHHATGNKNVAIGIWDHAKTLSMSTSKSKTYLEAEVLSFKNIKIKTALHINLISEQDSLILPWPSAVDIWKKTKNNFYLLLLSCLRTSVAVWFKIWQLHFMERKMQWKEQWNLEFTSNASDFLLLCTLFTWNIRCCIVKVTQVDRLLTMAKPDLLLLGFWRLKLERLSCLWYCFTVLNIRASTQRLAPSLLDYCFMSPRKEQDVHAETESVSQKETWWICYPVTITVNFSICDLFSSF